MLKKSVCPTIYSYLHVTESTPYYDNHDRLQVLLIL